MWYKIIKIKPEIKWSKYKQIEKFKYIKFGRLDSYLWKKIGMIYV